MGMKNELEYQVRTIQTANQRYITRNKSNVLQPYIADYQAEVADLRAECERLSKGWEQEVKRNEESKANKYHNLNLAWHAPGLGEVHSQDETLELQCLRSTDDDVEQDCIADDSLAQYVCDVLNAYSATIPYERSQVDCLNSPRRSGRTTRMLQHAIELAQTGRAVYVLASDNSHYEILRDSLFHLTQGDVTLLGIKVETPSSLGKAWDGCNHRILGAHPNCVLLTDHYLLERKVEETDYSMVALRLRMQGLRNLRFSQIKEARRWDIVVEPSTEKGEGHV